MENLPSRRCTAALDKNAHTALYYGAERRFSTSLTLPPFNPVPHGVVAPTIKLICCYFITVVIILVLLWIVTVNIWYPGWSRATPAKGLSNPQRGLEWLLVRMINCMEILLVTWLTKRYILMLALHGVPEGSTWKHERLPLINQECLQCSRDCISCRTFWTLCFLLLTAFVHRPDSWNHSLGLPLRATIQKPAYLKSL